MHRTLPWHINVDACAVRESHAGFEPSREQSSCNVHILASGLDMIQSANHCDSSAAAAPDKQPSSGVVKRSVLYIQLCTVGDFLVTSTAKRQGAWPDDASAAKSVLLLKPLDISANAQSSCAVMPPRAMITLYLTRARAQLCSNCHHFSHWRSRGCTQACCRPLVLLELCTSRFHAAADKSKPKGKDKGVPLAEAPAAVPEGTLDMHISVPRTVQGRDWLAHGICLQLWERCQVASNTEAHKDDQSAGKKGKGV